MKRTTINIIWNPVSAFENINKKKNLLKRFYPRRGHIKICKIHTFVSIISEKVSIKTVSKK